VNLNKGGDEAAIMRLSDVVFTKAITAFDKTNR